MGMEDFNMDDDEKQPSNQSSIDDFRLDEDLEQSSEKHRCRRNQVIAHS